MGISPTSGRAGMKSNGIPGQSLYIEVLSTGLGGSDRAADMTNPQGTRGRHEAWPRIPAPILQNTVSGHRVPWPWLPLDAGLAKSKVQL